MRWPARLHRFSLTQPMLGRHQARVTQLLVITRAVLAWLERQRETLTAMDRCMFIGLLTANSQITVQLDIPKQVFPRR